MAERDIAIEDGEDGDVRVRMPDEAGQSSGGRRIAGLATAGTFTKTASPELVGTLEPPALTPASQLADAEAELRALLTEETTVEALAALAADPNSSPAFAKGLQGMHAEINKIAVAKASAESREDIEEAMSAIAEGGWPTLDDCLPPGSILEAIDQGFVETSDIPREIPLFAALHYVSALLLQKGATLRTGGGTKRPDLWSIVLAPSGAGKTYALNEIRHAFGDGVDIFPKPDSDRQFVEHMTKHDRALWPKDEFAQFLGQIGKGGTMPKTKEYLLMCDEGGVLEYNTKGTSFRIENPGLTIFGATVIDTFTRHLGYESIVDGFAQRFGFIFAERDPDRPKLGEYTFRTDRGPAISKAWASHCANLDPSQPCFLRAPGAAAYQRAFEILLARAELAGVDEGYSRRLSARGLKYSLIYHFLLGKESPFVDSEDLGYGMRIASMHLRDTRRLLDMYGRSAAPKTPQGERDELRKAVAACLGRARDAGAAPVDARKLLQSVKRVKGGELARDLMREAVAADASLAPFADVSPPKPGAIGQRSKPPES
jgi:hypothetical protein